MSAQLRSAQLRFLDLPGEIREQVYRELLSSATNRHDIGDGKAQYKFHFEILLVNSQVHEEAREVFRRHNVFVRIETPWTQAVEHVRDEGRVPILCTGDEAVNFQDFHMSAIIGAADPRMDFPPTVKFILCLDDLASFCRMWFYSDLSHLGLNSNLTLTMRLRNPKSLTSDAEEEELPKTVQRRLLEPFGLVKGLGRVTVEGKHDKNVEQMMRTAMAVSYDSPEYCLEQATKLKDMGNTELKAGKYRNAIAHYEQSFAAMHIAVSGRVRNVWADQYFEKKLENGVFDGQYGGIVRMVLRIRLVANTILAYLKLEEFSDARFWGERSLNLMREALGDGADEPRMSFPAANEWGKVYYRTALACKALDDQNEARRLLRYAAAWLPQDEIVKKEYAAIALRLG